MNMEGAVNEHGSLSYITQKDDAFIHNHTRNSECINYSIMSQHTQSNGHQTSTNITAGQESLHETTNFKTTASASNARVNTSPALNSTSGLNVSLDATHPKNTSSSGGTSLKHAKSLSPIATSKTYLSTSASLNYFPSLPTTTHTRSQTLSNIPTNLQLESMQSNSPKRISGPKSGFLFKQSSGTWKRKRWSQRWFLLDPEARRLKYFRHASNIGAVPTRNEPHGVLMLNNKGASLVIQGDLPRGVPTPFCFTISDGSRAFRICTSTRQEFREWTAAISTVLNPNKALDSSNYQPNIPVVEYGSPSKDASTLESSSQSIDNIDRKVQLSKYICQVKAMSLKNGFQLLLFVNILAISIKLFSTRLLHILYVLVNSACIIYFWMQPSAGPQKTSLYRQEYRIHREFESDLIVKAQNIDNDINQEIIVQSTASETSQITFSSDLKELKPHFTGTVAGKKPIAGASVKMCPPTSASTESGCWTTVQASRFNVRQGPNYRKLKVKAPSKDALLDLVAIDIFRSSTKVDNIGRLMDLNKLAQDNGISTADFFIVNCQVPSYQPSNPIWGEKQGDGVGFNFACYFSIPLNVREQLQTAPDQDVSPTIRLLKNFMLESSDLHDRFKAIGVVVNPSEQIALGRTERHLLETYNGQPILTRPQHRFYRGQYYFEVDIDAHEFNYVARKGLLGVSEHFKTMVVDFGFVIEGQDDNELPEQILGAVRLCKIDVSAAPFMT